ncbi:hypothetical protein ET005_00240 [Lactococcus petauri]|nr:hypothetical protein [Lactococcus petauri]
MKYKIIVVHQGTNVDLIRVPIQIKTLTTIKLIIEKQSACFVKSKNIKVIEIAPPNLIKEGRKNWY